MKDKVRINLDHDELSPAEQMGIALCTVAVMMLVIWVAVVVFDLA